VFIFSKPKTKAVEVSKYVESLPKDGVMCDGPIAYFFAYQTNKRVVIIPHERVSDVYQTILSIQEFNLSYAVISNNHTKKYHPPATQFIQENFEFIYSTPEDNDVYFVYEIPEAVKSTKGLDSTEDNSLLCGSGEACCDQFISGIRVCWD